MPTQHQITRRVQFAETDMAGIAHFTNFYRWIEEVEHDWFRRMSLSIQMTIDGVEIGWPRVSASCDFLAPVRFEDELVLSLRLTRLGTSSLSHEVEFLLAGQRVALAKTTTVCCRITPGPIASIPIPQAIRDKIQSP